MPTKPKNPCTRCGQPSTGNGRCARHQRIQDHQRPTAAGRGYGGKNHQTFRTAVLRAAGYTCVECHAHATVADHHPHTRKELIRMGANPDSPDRGRALCETCHNRATANDQSNWGRKRAN